MIHYESSFFIFYKINYFIFNIISQIMPINIFYIIQITFNNIVATTLVRWSLFLQRANGYFILIPTTQTLL